MNAVARMIVEEARRRSYPWAGDYQEYGVDRDREAEPGSICYVVPVPGHEGHTLSLLQRGNTIEIAYDDGLPPGPAEKQFVGGPEEEVEVVRSAFAFVGALLAGRIVAVRRPLPWWVRLFRRDADSLLWFRERM